MSYNKKIKYRVQRIKLTYRLLSKGLDMPFKEKRLQTFSDLMAGLVLKKADEEQQEYKLAQLKNMIAKKKYSQDARPKKSKSNSQAQLPSFSNQKRYKSFRNSRDLQVRKQALIRICSSLGRKNYSKQSSKEVIQFTDKKNCTPLYKSAEAGDLHMVRMYVLEGGDVNRPCIKGKTPLHAAFRSGNPILINFLIDNGADLNALDDTGLTPLAEGTAETLKIFNLYREGVVFAPAGGSFDNHAIMHRTPAVKPLKYRYERAKSACQKMGQLIE